MRRKERGEERAMTPQGKRWQFKTAAVEQERQTHPGQGRSTKRFSLPPQGKRGCYRRESVTWSPGESRRGSPFLLTRQFFTTDSHLNFGGQKGPTPD